MLAARWIIFDLLVWVLPVFSGILACGYASYSLRRREAISTIMSCYVLSGVVLLFGVAGTWRSGLAIWEVLGVAGDISAELLYDGWKHSWWSLAISGLGATILLGIATVARVRRSRPPLPKPQADAAVTMAYPAGAVACLVIMGMAVESATPSFLSTSDLSPQAQLTYKLMAVALLGYYVLAFLGIPYFVVWGARLMRWRQRTTEERWRRVITGFYFVCALFTLAFTFAFFFSAIRGHNPFFLGGGQ